MRRYRVNKCRSVSDNVMGRRVLATLCASFSTGDALRYDVARDKSDEKSIEDVIRRKDACISYGKRADQKCFQLFNFMSIVCCRLYVEILIARLCE